MCKKRHQIIWTFLSNWEASIQEFFIKEFENRNTHILIYIDAAGIRVNIWDVAYAI